MQYPLKEKIGSPELLVGRGKEFKSFNRWLENIPRELSKSRVILARRKSGKTAFVQRIFNQLWSQNGQVIPFYFSIPERKAWYPLFAIEYYRTFASQYISFLERDPLGVRQLLSLDEIKDYGQANSLKLLVDDVTELQREMGIGHDLMWNVAHTAPHRFAAVYDQRVLVIIDEFQYLTKYIYPDQHYQLDPIETMPGSFHTMVESKVAPMLVTGSYVSWLIDITSKYLEAGRLSRWRMSPYLTSEEGLQAVYKYAELYNERITNETAILINQLCMSDPFFISCVVQSFYEDKALDTEEGVINTINYEITDYESEMSMTWSEYIALTLPKINDVNSKHILLHLSKHNDREWTPQEVQETLKLDMSLDEIQRKLQLMVEADVLVRGSSDIDYQGLQDGTLYLILRNRFEKEITSYAPDLRVDFRAEVKRLQADKSRLRGMLNNLTGKMAEYQLATAFRSKKRFALSAYFEGVVDDSRLNMIHVQTRVLQQRPDGKKQELDIVAESSCGRVVVVEVKKWQTKLSATHVEDFIEKVAVYRDEQADKTVLPAILSLGGFSDPARKACEEHGIGRATEIVWN
ncbi:restriction endonuclease [Anaerolineales bacterium HSG25]|nr:restriction endonuclease [Anaerolineales bacterium HSG25]